MTRTNIEQWLEIASAVAVWFGRIIGSRPPDVDDVAALGGDFAVCIANVTPFSIHLRDASSPSSTCVGGSQVRQIILQLRAARLVKSSISFVQSLLILKSQNASPIEARTIVVEHLDAWKMLRDAETPTILVIDPAVSVSSEDIPRAVSKGHHVLLAIEPAQSGRLKCHELERAAEFDLRQALEKCGYEPVRAEQLARSAGGSLAILKQRLAQVPASIMPTWAPGTIRCFGSLSSSGWLGRRK